MTAPDEAFVAGVIEKLSKAQRAAILAARDEGDEESFFLSGHNPTLQSLYDAKLVFIVWRGVMLNSLGLAVRHELLRRESGS